MAPRLAPLPADERDEEVAGLLQALRIGGVELNIFATLARHPRLLRRWAAFGGLLLGQGELGARQRELLILRTGWRCRSDYEWGQHAAMARATGFSEDDLAAVVAGPGDPAWTPLEAALLRAADELHDSATLADDTWAALAAELDERQLIEVPMVVGQYHLVAFTVKALRVEREPGVEGLPG